MRHDKEKVFELRRNGKSYREIGIITGVSRSTLCDWFKNEEWSLHIKKSNIDRQQKASTELLMKMNKARQISIDKKYEEIKKDAVREFEIYKKNPLFMAGLMLYAGEGDKMTKGMIRFANTDFELHKIFIKFIDLFMKIEMKHIRFSVLLYPDLNIEDCRLKWSQELNIPLSNFHKPIVIQGRHKTKRLHFGVGSTIISGSFLKRKLLLWVELVKKDLS